MITHLSLAGFVTQLLLGELLFLHPAEKERPFLLRLTFSWALLFFLTLIIPSRFFTNVLYQLCLFLLLFGLSVFFMNLAFHLPLSAVLACCVAGYAVQHVTFHLCSLLGNLGFLEGVSLFGLPSGQTRALLLTAPIYLLFYLTLGRYSARNECYKHYDKRFDLISFATVFICIGLSRIARFFGDMDTVTVNLYAITACIMALMIQIVLFRAVSLRHENEILNLLWQEDRRQFDLSKKTMDTIHIKYHDLKRLLQKMSLPKEEEKAIRDAVRVYQSHFHTGNEALDILLTENSLRLSEEGIPLTYMGNGDDLSFMNIMDVYSLFGNALDNAVEAVLSVPEKEKRFIDIVTECRGNLVLITIVNYFQGELSLRDGLPQTSKKEEQGFHGFGLKSMRLVAEKYGGDIDFTTENHLFTLNIYLLRDKDDEGSR